MNRPFDSVFDAHWQDGFLILPLLAIGRIPWEDARGWLMYSFKFGFRVTTGLHNYRLHGGKQ